MNHTEMPLANLIGHGDVAAYSFLEFEERVGVMDDTVVKSSSYDVVMAYVETKIGKFTPADVLANCPGVGRTSVFNALKKLNEEGFEIENKTIGDTTVYVVKEKEKAPSKGVLYLFGGGYILPPDPGDIVLCGQIAKECDAEVWFPLYPMAPEHKLIDTVQSTVKVYESMLSKYDRSNVRFFGTSSGGGLAMSVCMYIKHEGFSMPLPEKLVLQSPGLQVPPSKEQKDEMNLIKKDDVMIPPDFFDRIAPVLAKGEEEYLLSPLLFDISGFPSIDIFYGTKEVMYVYLKYMREHCKKYGVVLNEHVGEGMMHCWGAMEFVPEAKAVRQEYFAALR